MNERNNESQIGTPEFFGRVLTDTLIAHPGSQTERAEAIHTDPSTLSRLQSGKHPQPEREELIRWLKIWELPDDERARLLVAAGYIPEIPVEIKGTDFFILAEALSELLDPNASIDQPGFYVQILRMRLAKLANL